MTVYVLGEAFVKSSVESATHGFILYSPPLKKSKNKGFMSNVVSTFMEKGGLFFLFSVIFLFFFFFFAQKHSPVELCFSVTPMSKTVSVSQHLSDPGYLWLSSEPPPSKTLDEILQICSLVCQLADQQSVIQSVHFYFCQINVFCQMCFNCRCLVVSKKIKILTNG